MNKEEQLNKELAKKHAQDAAKRLFGTRTKEQNKALQDLKTLGSPDNLITPDEEDEVFPIKPSTDHKTSKE
jgi:hypothetical protein